MKGHAKQCVERYCQLADIDESSLRKVATPCIDDHQISPEEFQTTGKLHKECARRVLKCLFFSANRKTGPVMDRERPRKRSDQMDGGM